MDQEFFTNTLFKFLHLLIKFSSLATYYQLKKVIFCLDWKYPANISQLKISHYVDSSILLQVHFSCFFFPEGNQRVIRSVTHGYFVLSLATFARFQRVHFCRWQRIIFAEEKRKKEARFATTCSFLLKTHNRQNNSGYHYREK